MLVLKNGQCSQRHEFLPFRTALPRNATQRYTKMMAIHLRCLNNVEEEYSTYKVGRILATIVRIQLTRIPLNASIQHSPVNMGLSANRLPPIPIQVWTMITIRMKIRIYRVSMIFHNYDTSISGFYRPMNFWDFGISGPKLSETRGRGSFWVRLHAEPISSQSMRV